MIYVVDKNKYSYSNHEHMLGIIKDILFWFSKFVEPMKKI